MRPGGVGGGSGREGGRAVEVEEGGWVVVKGVDNAWGRGACHIDMLAAVVFEGGAEVKSAEAVLGPRSTGTGVYVCYTQLAGRMDGVGIEAEG